MRGFNRHIKEKYDPIATSIDGKPVKVWVGMRLLQPEQATLKDVDDTE